MFRGITAVAFVSLSLYPDKEFEKYFSVTPSPVLVTPAVLETSKDRFFHLNSVDATSHRTWCSFPDYQKVWCCPHQPPPSLTIMHFVVKIGPTSILPNASSFIFLFLLLFKTTPKNLSLPGRRHLFLLQLC